MLDKIIIVDFNDSFTYNIANVLYPHCPHLKVISHEFFFNTEQIEEISERTKQRLAIILGPGPGHPDDYQIYYEEIKKLMGLRHIYLMGICLGHQMIGKVLGKEISPAQTIIHGESIKYNFKEKNLRVQRYNSLAVYEKNDRKNEILELKLEQGISYQFHPESIGTTENLVFFEELLSFIK
jgi:anthranilate synthase component 2